jgi:hypothetical protein
LEKLYLSERLEKLPYISLDLRAGLGTRALSFALISLL